VGDKNQLNWIKIVIGGKKEVVTNSWSDGGEMVKKGAVGGGVYLRVNQFRRNRPQWEEGGRIEMDSEAEEGPSA